VSTLAFSVLQKDMNITAAVGILAVLLTTTLLGMSFSFFLSGFKDVENGAL
jgi:hypothetical protein